MTIEEYKLLKQEYAEQALKKERRLAYIFATSNNTVKVGDIITDHIGSIKVEKISWGYFGSSGNISLPSCVYNGVVLKKDKTPTKRGNNRKVYQINLKN